jgi:hypothetical protein
MTDLDHHSHASGIALRLAGTADGSAVEALRQRDTQPLPRWPLLVAEVDGSIRAALSLATGQELADPFHHTAHLRPLLAARAAQLKHPRPRRLAFRRAQHYARPETA